MHVLKQAGIVVFEREWTQISDEPASPKIGEACERLHEFLVERFGGESKYKVGRKFPRRRVDAHFICASYRKIEVETNHLKNLVEIRTDTKLWKI